MWTDLALMVAGAALFIGGITVGYRMGITDTEQRWNDAVKRAGLR